jgi:hypothetical protein
VNKKYISFITLLFVAFLCSYVFAGQNELIIKFGYMTESSSGMYVSNETTTIPLKLKNTGFRFGFTVKHKKNGSFEGYHIIYLPAPPKEITDVLKKAVVSAEGKVIESLKERYDGFWANAFWFDEGDPVGDWKIEIYIDGKLAKSLDFTVVR